MNGEATEAAVERVYCHLAATNSLTWKDSFFPLQKYSWTLLRSFFHACMEYVGFALMLYKMKCFFGGLKSRGWRLVKEQISHFDTVVVHYLLILYWCSQCFSFSLHRDRAEPVVLNNHGRCTLKTTTRQEKCFPLAAAARSKQLEQLFTSVAQTSGSTLINIFSRIAPAS